MDDIHHLLNAASAVVAHGMDLLKIGPHGAYMVIIADGSKVYIGTDVDQGQFKEFVTWATENVDDLHTLPSGTTQ